MRHKHADVIHAWAEGAIIQYKNSYVDWGDCHDNKPTWNRNTEYRIKPTPMPDVVRYYNVDSSGFPIGHLEQHTGHLEQHKNTNLKLTIDGETGELKSAEVLK